MPSYVISNGGAYYAGFQETPLPHEAGHAIGNLGDEYIDFGFAGNFAANPLAEPPDPNIAGRGKRELVEWADLIAPDALVPATFAHEGIGVFPGAEHYEAGAFRPSWDSIMRYGYRFDAVGRRALDARMAALFDANAADDPTPGNWYDRRHNSHGIDLQRYGRDAAGDLYFVTLYTYDQTGAPEWYQAVGHISAGQFLPLVTPNGKTLTRVRGTQGQPDAALSGDLAIDFTGTAACKTPDRAGAVQLATMYWSIGGRSAFWCIEPAITRAQNATPKLSGHWYAPSDPGWGMEVLSIADGSGAPTLVAILYYRDSRGEPRWATASSADYTAGQALTLYETANGYCRHCTAPPSLTQAAIGRITLTLTAPLRESPASAANRVDVDLALPGGITFRKADVPVTLLSEPMQ